MEVVFVYGTLKEGFPNFHINQGRRLPGSWRTEAAYALYLVGSRSSPWMRAEAVNGLSVRGQLFEVSADGLAAMDRLERVDAEDGYRRRRIQVLPCDADRSAASWAWVYLKPTEQWGGQMIVEGPMSEYLPAHAARYQARSV